MNFKTFFTKNFAAFYGIRNFNHFRKLKRQVNKNSRCNEFYPFYETKISNFSYFGDIMSSKSEELAVQYFEAVEADNITQVEELLSSGAVNVDLPNPQSFDRTALHIAGQKGYFDLARLLVDKYHAQVNIKDKNGKIPLQIATDYYHMQIVKFLLQRNSNLREYAQRHLNTQEIEDLFEAAESNNIKKISELITEHGVHVDSEDRSNFCRTILEIAATKGYYDLVRVLVDTYGADIQHQDEIGDCAKHMAANNKHENIVNFLLERGFREEYSSDSSDESDV